MKGDKILGIILLAGWFISLATREMGYVYSTNAIYSACGNRMGIC
jgi:hypothetical protein